MRAEVGGKQTSLKLEHTRANMKYYIHFREKR